MLFITFRFNPVTYIYLLYHMYKVHDSCLFGERVVFRGSGVVFWAGSREKGEGEEGGGGNGATISKAPAMM